MRRFSFPVVLTALALVAPSAFSQCLEVRVVDPDSLPVANAVVRQGDTEARTGADGRTRLCPGSDELVRISARGFAPVERTPSGDVLTVRTELATQADSTVVVTGTTRPQEIAEVDRSLRALSVQDPNVPAWSFADLLKQDTSVSIRARGGDGTQADLSIRGSGFDQNLVMINGVRVSDAQTGHHSMDLPLPLEAVGQVEVLHGGGATLYGSDAIGGAVNFVTRKPPAGELRLMGGTGEHGWHRQAANGAFRRGIWTQTLAFSRDDSSGFMPGRDFGNTAFSSETFLDHSIGTTNVLVAHNDRPFGANGYYGPYDSWEETGTTFLSAAQTFGRESSRHRASFAFRRHDDNFILCRSGCVFGGVQYAPGDFQNLHTLDTYQGNYQFDRDLTDRVRVSAGAQILSERIDSTVAGQRNRERAAVFVMFNLRPTDRLTLTAGVREEAWKRWVVQTSPTFAAGYRLAAGFKVRAHAGRAFRIPTYTDLYHRDPANVGNPGLLPETAWNYEAGVDWYGNQGTRVSATWFQRRERNAIDWVKDEGSAVFQARNFQELDFNGFEVEVRQRFGRMHEAWVGYTGLEADRLLPVNAISQYTFNFPLNNTVVGYRGTLVERVVLKTQLGVYNRTWQSSRGLWDIALSWDGERFSPFIQATNLADVSHEAFQGLRQPGRWVRGGLRIRVF